MHPKILAKSHERAGNLKIQYTQNGTVRVVFIEPPMGSDKTADASVVIRPENADEKERVIYGLTGRDATENALAFLRALADDNELLIIDTST
jgi:hypothetical protein